MQAYATCFQVRYNSLILWDQWQGAHPGRKLSDDPVPINRSAYSGDITTGSKKRLRRVLDVFLQLSPRRYVTNPATEKRMLFQLAFVTLTVSSPRIISHSEASKTCLAKFLRFLRVQKAAYIWKAELQKSGQIHYHVTINQPIHHAKIRSEWNKYQEAAGYLREFEQEHGHKSPNSTDIHSVGNVKDLQAYIVKYISKGVSIPAPGGKGLFEAGFPFLPEIKIDGKVWDCSESLKQIKLFQAEDDQDIWNEAGKYGYQKSLDQCGIVVGVKPESYLSKSNLKKYRHWQKDGMLALSGIAQAPSQTTKSTQATSQNHQTDQTTKSTQATSENTDMTQATRQNIDMTQAPNQIELFKIDTGDRPNTKKQSNSNYRNQFITPQ